MNSNCWLLGIHMILISTPFCAEVYIVEDAQDFNKMVVLSEKPTVVKFFATWCQACKQIKKAFAEIADDPEFKDIVFIEVDVDKVPLTLENHTIAVIPTIYYMHNGVLKKETRGIKKFR